MSEGFHVSFVGQFSQGAIQQIQSLAVNVLALRSSTDWLEHSEALRSLNRTDPVSVLVVDNYALVSDVNDWVGELNQVVLACFEDGEPLACQADLIVNSGVDEVSSPWILDNLAARSRAHVLGVEAAIIRSELFRVRDLRDEILPRLRETPFGYINFGLSESQEPAQAFIEMVSKARFKLPFEFQMVLNNQTKKISYGQDMTWPRGLSIAKQQVDFIDLLARATAAIGAAGVSAYERAFLGIPSINCPISENQVGISKILAGHGAAIDLELGWQAEELEMKHALDRLASESARFEMSRSARGLVDGMGSERVLAKILTLLGETK